MINSKILELIRKKDIPFAIIDGKYDIDFYSNKKESVSADLDIVLKLDSISIIQDIRSDHQFESLDQFSFKEKETNLRVDIYINTINVGYYHFLKIDDTSFSNQRVSDEEYVIYQLLDPLLKFSQYLPRHKYRLQYYFEEGISDNIVLMLEKIIGCTLANRLLNQIFEGNFNVSQLFIRMCKINILLINGNFVKMIKKRIYK